ncbi:hypothetical protein Ciccas_006000 [Cichlidogyrus casuarinus]|uniref:Uncharacterized protein n=1 Tax=Cichlidogyrus casuarinus TaxID=1844966 RepID=A0ABD2Q716_9PLAT
MLITCKFRINSEIQQLRTEKDALLIARSNCDIRIKELEREVIHSRNEIQDLRIRLQQERLPYGDGDQVPFSSVGCFTRADMSKVIIEKNHYKEHYLALKEHLETQQLQNQGTSRRQSSFGRNIKDFFSRLVKPSSSVGESVHFNSSAPDIHASSLISSTIPSSSVISNNSRPSTQQRETSPEEPAARPFPDKSVRWLKEDQQSQEGICSKSGWVCPTMRSLPVEQPSVSAELINKRLG